ITTTPFMATVSSIARIASTAAWSAAFLSPRPIQRPHPSAAASVTRTSSSARFRSGAVPFVIRPGSYGTLGADRRPAYPRLVRALVAFAVAVTVFHHVPAVAGDLGDWIDLATPFVVVGAAALVLLGLSAWGAGLGVAVAAAIAYVDGHGLHLAANSIRAETPVGEVERVAYFWDERFSHWEWHVGLIGLLVAFCLAEPRARPPALASPAQTVLVAALLGF